MTIVYDGGMLSFSYHPSSQLSCLHVVILAMNAVEHCTNREVSSSPSQEKSSSTSCNKLVSACPFLCLPAGVQFAGLTLDCSG